MNHVTLKLVHVLHSFFLHQSLAFRTFLPGGLPGFIATDMDIFGREKIDHLRQYVFHECKRLLVTDTKIAVLVRLSRTAQFRIGHQDLFRMPRKFDLRYYVYMFGSRMFHDLPDVLLRIVTAVSTRRPFRQILTVAAVPPLPPIRFGAEGRFRSKFRIFVYLDTPSSGIRQMHMQGVQLVKRHHIQQFHHFLFGEEMTGYIQMQSPIPKTRIIPDRNTWDLSSGIELA